MKAGAVQDYHVQYVHCLMPHVYPGAPTPHVSMTLLHFCTLDFKRCSQLLHLSSAVVVRPAVALSCTLLIVCSLLNHSGIKAHIIICSVLVPLLPDPDTLLLPSSAWSFVELNLSC